VRSEATQALISLLRLATIRRQKERRVGPAFDNLKVSGTYVATMMVQESILAGKWMNV
jgi:hypothetical protein